ncbi:MAG: hypothetical protein QOF24_2554 [Verrucomicrobiota bacterium]
MDPKDFFAELKRRNVYKVAVAYAVVGWLVMQVSATIVPALHLPDGITTAVVVLVLLGFPVALVIAWAFEMTPQGMKRTENVGSDEVIPQWSGRKFAALIIVIAIVATALLVFTLLRSNAPHLEGGVLATPTTDGLAGAQPPIPPKSIAVLPFVNMSSDKENAFFTDGVQDQILTDLAKVADLKVISRTSVMQYRDSGQRNLREIASALGVAHVLEGSVQRVTNRVRVSAQLIDARTDTHIWAETYDRDLADVFAIQSEIAKTIAAQLRAKLSPTENNAIKKPPTTDVAAYDLYLRARHLVHVGDKFPSPEEYSNAVLLLDEAVARDSAFLLAHCQLAAIHDLFYLSNIDHTEARLALAEKSVKTAVRLDPDAGETHLAQAVHFYWGYRNYERAREELALAQRTLPNNSEIFEFLGLIDRRQAHWDEAIRNLEQAASLDPQNLSFLDELNTTYFFLRRYPEALATCKRALAIAPRNRSFRLAAEEIAAESTANLAPLRIAINAIEAEGPSSLAAVALRYSFPLALRERDPVAAARALANSRNEENTETFFRFPRAWYEGLLARLQQDAPAAHSAFAAARVESEKIVRAQAGNATALSVLGLIDAQLGEKEKAIQEGRAACDLLPPAKDAPVGVALITNLARIYALTGEKDLALQQLEIVSKLPYGPSYGDLRLDLEWDALRCDSRFEHIAASLAPKN